MTSAEILEGLSLIDGGHWKLDRTNGRAFVSTGGPSGPSDMTWEVRESPSKRWYGIVHRTGHHRDRGYAEGPYALTAKGALSSLKTFLREAVR